MISDMLMGAIIAVALFGLFFFVPFMEGRDRYWRNELVRRGYAEYVLDAAHDRQWRWKEDK